MQYKTHVIFDSNKLFDSQKTRNAAFTYFFVACKRNGKMVLPASIRMFTVKRSLQGTICHFTLKGVLLSIHVNNKFALIFIYILHMA